MWPFKPKKTPFSVTLYMKSGNKIEFPKGYFSGFSSVKGIKGLSKLEWEINPGEGQLQYVDIDEIEAIVVFE